jgi:hypothetical protein
MAAQVSLAGMTTQAWPRRGLGTPLQPAVGGGLPLLTIIG